MTRVRVLQLDELTTVQRDALISPANGLFIWNSNTDRLEVNTGTPGASVWRNAINTSNQGQIKINGSYI